MKIKIGKEGDQPFAIKASGVSRLHAVVDIDEDRGTWTLTDLDSANGTYIREATGDFRRVSQMEIHPMTFICLGGDNSKGCSFYARQLLAPGDFHDELRFIMSKEDEFDIQQRKVERYVTVLRLIQTIVPMAVFSLSMLLWKENGMGSYMVRAVGAALPSIILQLVFNPQKRLSDLRTQADKFRHCPNPECSHKLRSQDIRNRECPYCNKI